MKEGLESAHVKMQCIWQRARANRGAIRAGGVGEPMTLSRFRHPTSTRIC